ncbi:MAG: hypothetical protein R2716_07990 [Microthrixaceae bacterium]
MVLGIGGVRALQALGEPVEVFHTNEGHAGFMCLERIRSLVVDRGLGFGAALAQVRASSVFTTHTPVPAGMERFDRSLMERYFGGWAVDCGVDLDALMELGHSPGDSARATRSTWRSWACACRGSETGCRGPTGPPAGPCSATSGRVCRPPRCR